MIIVAILTLLSMVALFAGFLAFAGSGSATHEIEAMLIFILSAVLFVGAVLAELVGSIKKNLTRDIKALINVAQDAFKENWHAGQAQEKLLRQIAKHAANATEKTPPNIAPEPTVGGRYYISRDEKDLGPYTLQELVQMKTEGGLSGDTLVFREGDTNWRQLEDILPP